MQRRPWSVLERLSLIALALTGQGLSAQCQSAWSLPTGFAVQGAVETMLPWDPDGTGPAPAGLVIGGSFASAFGLRAANGIVQSAAGTWSPLGSGVRGILRTLATLPDNSLVVAGDIDQAGGMPVNGIARWDGTTWHALGSGISGGTICCLAVGPAGDLFAAGSFTAAGGQPANKIARWNGMTWTSLGAGLTGLPFGTIPPTVRGLAFLPNGDLVAVGGFTLAGGVPAAQIARWNGTSWSAGGLALSPFQSVRSVTSTAGGVVVGVADQQAVHFWNGVTWTFLGPPASNPDVLLALPNGDLLAAGGNAFNGMGVNRLRGGTWTSLGAMPGDLAGALGPRALVRPPMASADEFWVGGTFFQVGAQSAASIARWDGTRWHGTPAAMPALTTVAVEANGDIVVGGEFQAIQGAAAERVARWNGSNWQALGAGLPAAPTLLATRPQGDILANLRTGSVLRWDGTSWNALAVPFPGILVAGPGQRLAMLARFSAVTVFSGSIWQNVPNLTSPRCAAFFADGRLIVGGIPPTAGRIAAWDGTAWTPLDPTDALAAPPEGIVALRNGEVFVAGSFPNFGAVARRVGTTWQPAGLGLDGQVQWMRELPNGDLLAAGWFTASGATRLPGIARWNGNAWLPLDGVALGSARADRQFLPTGLGIASAAVHPTGDVLLAGSMASPAPGLARSVTSCPAAATALGNGCTGAGANHRLVAPSWPLVGGTFSVLGTGLPPNSLVVGVASVTSTQTPIASLLPQGQPGCLLHVAPDHVQFLAVQGGTSESSWAVPAMPALIGVTFRHQLLPVGLDNLGTIVAVTATNALALTIGMFL